MRKSKEPDIPRDVASIGPSFELIYAGRCRNWTKTKPEIADADVDVDATPWPKGIHKQMDTLE